MSFRTLAARRRLAGLLGATILLLGLALLVDGMIAGGRKDPDAFDLLPGRSLTLSETMPRGAEGLQDMVLKPSHPGIALRFKETFSGFWLGGTLWRAEGKLAGDLPPGAYTVAVQYQNGTEATPRQRFTINVRKDVQALQAASLSVTTRRTGLSPYLLAACLLLLALAPILASFLLSRKIASALRQLGMAEVYRAMATAEGQRIFFGLGSNLGLAQGLTLEVLDERAESVLGKALVAKVAAEDAEAVMQDGAQVRPGVLVRPAAQA